jgi:uncharacterized membrane protein YphA (DoxX/SURF4 family)
MPPSPPLTEMAHSLLRDMGALLARLLTAWALLVFHAWDEARAGFRHFFGPKDPWPLSQAMTDAGLPAGLAMASALTFALGGIVVAFTFGLLTRVAAFVLLVTTVAVVALATSDSLQESAGAYAAVACALLFGGPGNVSLDALIVHWRDLKRKVPPKYR